MTERDTLDREIAFARTLVGQLVDELREQRQRLIKVPRPKTRGFEYDLWLTQDHLDHLRDALNAYKPRGKSKTVMNERLLRRLSWLEKLWQDDDHSDREADDWQTYEQNQQDEEMGWLNQ